MKTIGMVASLALLIGIVSAQERIPQEQATKYAAFFVKSAAKLTDLPLKIEADAEKPFGMKANDLGAMVIPDKKISQEAIQKADKEVVPVGQLWLRNLTTVAEGISTPKDKLLMVTLTSKDQEIVLPLFLLGVQKKNNGSLALALYAKGKEPHMLLPLEPIDTNQELPLEFEAVKGDNDTGTLVLSILGKYRARLEVRKQE